MALYSWSDCFIQCNIIRKLARRTIVLLAVYSLHECLRLLLYILMFLVINGYLQYVYKWFFYQKTYCRKNNTSLWLSNSVSSFRAGGSGFEPSRFPCNKINETWNRPALHVERIWIYHQNEDLRVLFSFNLK